MKDGNQAAKAGNPFVELKEQREQAVACAVLSFAISLALVLSNIPGDRRPIENAARQVQLHRRLIIEAQQALKANEDVLKQNENALATMRAAQNRNRP